VTNTRIGLIQEDIPSPDCIEWWSEVLCGGGWAAALLFCSQCEVVGCAAGAAVAVMTCHMTTSEHLKLTAKGWLRCQVYCSLCCYSLHAVVEQLAVISWFQRQAPATSISGCVLLQVRRAKLFYLRERTGKNARLKELFVRKDKAAAAAAKAE